MSLQSDPHHTGLVWVEHDVRPDGLTRCGDCVTRSIVMATGLDYEWVWESLTELKTKKKGQTVNKKRGTASTGVPHYISRNYLKSLGWKYIDCKDGEKFVKDNLPDVCIADLPGHYVFVKNGVVYDTYDSRGKRKRKLEGYYVPEEGAVMPEHALV